MFFYFILLSNVFAYNPTWKELYDSSGWSHSHTVDTDVGNIYVYKKEVGSLPCFQGKVATKIEPKILIEIAADAESAIEWSSADLTEAKELSRTKSYVEYYQYLDIPIFSDRYWFARGYFETDGKTLLFHWNKLDQGGEHPEFYKEIQEKYPSAEETLINIGGWVFTPEEGMTTIQYLICTHPGGSVPTMFQSVGTEQTLPNNLRDIIIEAKRRAN